MRDKRPIPGYEGKYWITEQGEVFNTEGHKLKPIYNTAGVQQIELRKDGQRDLIPIDILVAVAWR